MVGVGIGALEIVPAAVYPSVKTTGISTNKLEPIAATVFKQDRKYWSAEPIQFSGNKVYQRNDLINPNKIGSDGRTNLQRMKDGISPIGSDNKSINLHHMLQTQNGPIAEMTSSFHFSKSNFSTIHINPGNTIPSGINRNEFNKWKRQHWINRANDFK